MAGDMMGKCDMEGREAREGINSRDWVWESNGPLGVEAPVEWYESDISSSSLSFSSGSMGSSMGSTDFETDEAGAGGCVAEVCLAAVLSALRSVMHFSR
jgi:hypothetical protein